MSVNWVLAGISIGPLLYIFVTLFSRSIYTAEEYEFGSRKVHPVGVLDSSIMYALQVAAIALFATWGWQYGFWAVIVSIFWLAGYFAMSFVLTDRFLERFACDDKFRTLHSFLAGDHPSRSVCIVAAIITLVGLAGPSMFEAFFVGRTIAASVPIMGNAGGASLSLIFIFVAVIYLIRGGFPGVIRLDQLQLLIGFGGFSISFALILNIFASRIGYEVSFILNSICFAVVLVMVWCKYSYDRRTAKYMISLTNNKPSLDYLGIISAILSLSSFAYSAFNSFRQIDSFDYTLFSFASANSNFGYTALATISLFIANATYQFVDVTQWQRLLSITVNPSDIPATIRVFRGNLIVGGICSACTWIVAVMFGIFLRYMFPNPDTNPYGLVEAFISELASQQGLISSIAIAIFVASLVAIMFSTLDSLIASTSFTVQNDILSPLNKKYKSLTLARVSTVLIVVLQLVFYLSISEVSGDRVDAVLYICWSLQLALLPVVVALLRKRSGPYWSKILSMLAGCIAALIPFGIGSPELTYEISPWLTVLVASIVYMVLGGANRAKTSEE